MPLLNANGGIIEMKIFCESSGTYNAFYIPPHTRPYAIDFKFYRLITLTNVWISSVRSFVQISFSIFNVSGGITPARRSSVLNLRGKGRAHQKGNRRTVING